MSEIPRTDNTGNNPDHANDNPRTQENGRTESGYNRGQKIGAGVTAALVLGGGLIGSFKAGEYGERTKQEPVVAAMEERINVLKLQSRMMKYGGTGRSSMITPKALCTTGSKLPYNQTSLARSQRSRQTRVS